VRLIDKVLVIWCAVSVAFWVFYALVSGKLVPFIIYYPLWLGVVGTLIWRHRVAVRARLTRWRAPDAVKFLLLAFGAVLSEEVIATLANHVPEGFSPGLFALRIGQFWALNVFTFFGFSVGWLILTRVLDFTDREVFYLGGLFGLYAEKVIFALPASPAFFLFDFCPTMFTYGLIITPALLSRSNRPAGRRLHAALKYPLTYLVIFACSIPAVLLLVALRERFPAMFPPVSMVPL